jgi:hypothetical protein
MFNDMNVRDTAIKPDADTIAKHMRIQTKASNFWIR